MIRQYFHLLATRMRPIVCVVTLLMFFIGSVAPALAMSSDLGGALPRPLPLFPPDNWWNLDSAVGRWIPTRRITFHTSITAASVASIPILGVTLAQRNDRNAIYGMPYAVVSGVTANDLKAVQFQYWDESDGVELHTGNRFPFYPIPPEAIAQARWIEAVIQVTSIGAAAKIDISSLSITNAIFSMNCITCFMTRPRKNGSPLPAPSLI